MWEGRALRTDWKQAVGIWRLSTREVSFEWWNCLKKQAEIKGISHPLTDDILLALPSTENRGPALM